MAAKFTAGEMWLPAISIEIAVPSAEPKRPKPILTANASASSCPLNHLTIVRLTSTQTVSNPVPNKIRPTIIHVSCVFGSSPKNPLAAKAVIAAPKVAKPPKIIPEILIPHLSRIIPPTIIIPARLAQVVALIINPKSVLENPNSDSIKGFKPEKKS